MYSQTSAPTNQNDSTVYQMNILQDQRCLLTAHKYTDIY